jgi:hypothetical protein
LLECVPFNIAEHYISSLLSLPCHHRLRHGYAALAIVCKRIFAFERIRERSAECEEARGLPVNERGECERRSIEEDA